METFTKFLYDFLGQFFSGIGTMFSGIGKGIQMALNIGSYSEIIGKYKNDFSMPEWILVAISIGLIVFFLRTYRTTYIFYNKEIWKNT